MKTKKGRTTKIYAINIERKRSLKQRREKALQNGKDRKLAKANLLVALQADRWANRASNDTQSSTNTNDELIDGSNTDTVMGIGNTDNTAIAAENFDNDATNAENTDNAAINAGNTSNAATDGEKSDDAAMSNDNIDNAAMSNNNTDDAVTGDGNTENTSAGETSTVDVPSPLCNDRKTKDPSKANTSKKHTPSMVEPSEPLIGDPLPDEITTAMVSGHAFDPTDMCIYELLIQGTPNPLDLEAIEEDQLLEIQPNIQDKLKQRDEERERNITKRMKQYEEKYDIINKALLESVAQITIMTKTDQTTAAARVKPADKMVMLLPLFDGSKPEVAKQHYE